MYRVMTWRFDWVWRLPDLHDVWIHTGWRGPLPWPDFNARAKRYFRARVARKRRERRQGVR